jgi:hypothetical protein
MCVFLLNTIIYNQATINFKRLNMKKPKLETAAIIAILLLAVAISCLPQIGTGTTNLYQKNLSTELNYGALQLTKHKILPTELEQYRSGIGNYLENSNYNQIVKGHGTGLSPPTIEEWAGIAQNSFVVDQITLQAALPNQTDVSASAWFPPIGDQGQQGSCASFSIGYYCKSYQEAKEHQWNLTQASWTGGDNNGNISVAYQSQVMSPAFVYNLINGGIDQGSDFETPIRLVCNVGICSWANMPYYWQNYTRWPSETAWAQAPLYRSNSTYSYQYLYSDTNQGIVNLKSWLAAGNLAVTAIDATDNLYPLTVRSDIDMITTDAFVNGELDHAATIVGYDDTMAYMENGSLAHGAFKIANSWGKGGWEDIADGCYWISYKAMKQLTGVQNPVILFEDLTSYLPQITANFSITHSSSGECDIIFGLGTPNAPIATKHFNDFVFGGNRAFPQGNMAFDISEFKDYATCLYNQPFFMQIYDSETNKTGTVNSFSIADSNSPQAPTQTINSVKVNLTLTYSLAPATLSVLQTSGAPSENITLKGLGFTGAPVDISYLNPLAPSQWIPITTNFTLESMNFTYTTNAPDLLQSNPTGDNQPDFNSIIFKAQDSGNGKSTNSTTAYNEWSRGLIQVSSQTAMGLFGNKTDLSTSVFVQNGQQLVFSGKWFSSGSAWILWDNLKLGQTSVNETGFFNATVTIPVTAAGKHVLIVDDGVSNVSVTLSRLPTLSSDYANLWHTTDYTVTLTPDLSGIQIYYKINSGQTFSLTAFGQPTITSEGSGNTLEYWGIWDVYGTGNYELTHAIIMGIKLDKTTPEALMQINDGAATTTSTSVTLTITATDTASGIKQMRLSNNPAFDQAVWETYSTVKSWQLPSGDGTKTIYCQIQNNADLTTSIGAIITLNTGQQTSTSTSTPTQTTSPTPTSTTSTDPTPTIPEYTILMTFALLAVATVLLTILQYRKKIQRDFV